MLRLLWKLVLEVLPPACATVVAGILLSAYRDHILPLQNIIDPRTSVEQTATRAPEVGDQRRTATRLQEEEHAATPADVDGKSSAPDTNSQARESNEGKASQVKGPDTKVSEPKPPEASTADVQAAQLNAVLMASAPMAPPAEMKAAQAPETKAPDNPPADGQSAAPPAPTASPDPAEAAKAADVSPPPAKPAAAKSPDGKAVASVLRPRSSQHLERPAHKGTSPKPDWDKLPPAVAMLPLPAPAAPPMISMEPPAQVPQNRQTLPPAGQIPPPIVPNAGAANASGPTGLQPLPVTPPAGLSAGQDGGAKTQEPKRVFGVPIPPPIVAVGDALDPRPVFSASQRVFEKIVMAAKSVVPDFSHEP